MFSQDMTREGKNGRNEKTAACLVKPVQDMTAFMGNQGLLQMKSSDTSVIQRMTVVTQSEDGQNQIARRFKTQGWKILQKAGLEKSDTGIGLMDAGFSHEQQLEVVTLPGFWEAAWEGAAKEKKIGDLKGTGVREEVELPQGAASPDAHKFEVLKRIADDAETLIKGKGGAVAPHIALTKIGDTLFIALNTCLIRPALDAVRADERKAGTDGTLLDAQSMPTADIRNAAPADRLSADPAAGYHTLDIGSSLLEWGVKEAVNNLSGAPPDDMSPDAQYYVKQLCDSVNNYIVVGGDHMPYKLADPRRTLHGEMLISEYLLEVENDRTKLEDLRDDEYRVIRFGGTLPPCDDCRTRLVGGPAVKKAYHGKLSVQTEADEAGTAADPPVVLDDLGPSYSDSFKADPKLKSTARVVPETGREFDNTYDILHLESGEAYSLRQSIHAAPPARPGSGHRARGKP